LAQGRGSKSIKCHNTVVNGRLKMPVQGRFGTPLDGFVQRAKALGSQAHFHFRTMIAMKSSILVNGSNHKAKDIGAHVHHRKSIPGTMHHL
jgi:hypothetical protein